MHTHTHTPTCVHLWDTLDQCVDQLYVELFYNPLQTVEVLEVLLPDSLLTPPSECYDFIRPRMSPRN